MPTLLPYSNKELLALVAERKIQFIDLQFTDVGGAVKNVTIPTKELHRRICTNCRERYVSRPGYIDVCCPSLVEGQ